VLTIARGKWPGGFRASDVSVFIGHGSADAFDLKSAIEKATGEPILVLTSTIFTARLKALAKTPVALDDGQILVLRYSPGKKVGGLFSVENLSR
jgi:hypothetical protein